MGSDEEFGPKLPPTMTEKSIVISSDSEVGDEKWKEKKKKNDKKKHKERKKYKKKKDSKEVNIVIPLIVLWKGEKEKLHMKKIINTKRKDVIPPLLASESEIILVLIS